MTVAEQDMKQCVVQELEKLPLEKLGEVLDFAVFLKDRATWKETHIPVTFLPASHLDGLVGLVSWGGDALVDSEHLYYGKS
jgi:hypothetical protein